MRRFMKFAALAVIPAATLIGTASLASANVAVTNGVGHVDKGDVQTALHWNNTDFDNNVVQFTAGYTATFDNVLTCRNGAVDHVLVTSTGSGILTATPIKSSNGKQITGWNLGRPAVSATNDTNQIIPHLFTACGDGTIPTGLDMPTNPTVTFDGLKVNGVDLPNTPVVAPV